MINVDASPLQAARELRGVGLVVAARTAGLSVAQVEALEQGLVDAFGTTAEMIAAAVLYGASIGIGRDEAMTLLDRTLAMGSAPAPTAPVETPAVAAPAAPAAPAGTMAFSAAVQHRSAAIAVDPLALDPIATEPIVAPDVAHRAPIIDTSLAAPIDDLFADALDTPVDQPVAAPIREARPAPIPDAVPAPPVTTFRAKALPARSAYVAPELGTVQHDLDLGDLPVFELPSQRTRADDAFDDDYDISAEDTGEMPAVQPLGEFDSAFADEQTVEQWEDDAAPAAHDHTQPAPLANVVERADALLERTLGRERADRVFATGGRVSAATRETVADLRERLDRSEHATLIVAVGVGVMLIALLIGITSVFGGGSHKAVKPAATTTPAVAAAPKVIRGKDGLLLPAALRVVILNAGHTAGSASQMATRLKAQGYTRVDVANSHTRYGSPVILYAPTLRREAQRLSKQTGITTFDTTPAKGGTPTLTVVVV